MERKKKKVFKIIYLDLQQIPTNYDITKGKYSSQLSGQISIAFMVKRAHCPAKPIKK